MRKTSLTNRLGYLLDSHRPIGYLFVVMVLYAAFHRFIIPESIGSSWLQDNGWISWYTLILIAAALVFVVRGTFAATLNRRRWDLTALAYLGLIYFLRELDFHRLFTTEHVTRLRFYSDTGIPFFERFFPGIIMLLFVFCAVLVFFRYAIPLIRAFFNGEPWSSAVVAWFVTLILSQVVDQILRKNYTGRVIEELLEATAAGLALLAVLYVRRRPLPLALHSGRP